MPTQFGHYDLHELLGRGGMGEVHRAWDRQQSRWVALKLLSPVLASDEGFVERFRREALATATLTDPHVIPIHHFGEIDGRLYIDMRLVEGADLAHLLAREGAQPAERAAVVIDQAAAALDAAHAAGMLHRDVKPSNLLVTNGGFVYLVDFGLVQALGAGSGSSLTSVGLTIGTFGYMAPERMSANRQVGPAADVYSLTCVLFEALTGRRPFAAPDIAALTVAHLQEPPPRVSDMRPELSRRWDDVIARGMAKDPADRFPTAGALGAAARQAAGLAAEPHRSTGATAAGEATVPTETRLSPRRTVPAETPVTPAGPDPRRRRLAWILGGVAAAVAVAVLLTFAFLGGWFTGSGAAEAGRTTAAGTTTTVSSPPTTTPPTTPPTTEVVVAQKFDAGLMSIFPDLAEPPGITCAPYAPKAGEFVGPAGVLPAAVVACDYAAVPTGKVYYLRWPDVGTGAQWVQGLRAKFQVVPGMDSTQFQTNGIVQGQYFAAQSGRAGVLVYACYDRVPECVTVQGPSPTEAQQLWDTWTGTRQ